jgi:segregation and condensation protein A
MKALAAALERLPPAPEPERLQRAILNLAERRESVIAAVRRRGSLPFTRLVAECRSRLEAIVTFLAVLDLLKTEELQAEQSDSFGEIILTARGRSPGAVATTA